MRDVPRQIQGCVPVAAAAHFAAALEETLDGVDSSRWAFTREPGTPSRWEAHPVAVDQGSGEEVASERAKRLAVGGSGADGGAV